MNIQKKLIKTLLLVSLLAMTACGANKQSGSLDSSSRVITSSTGTGGGTSTNTNKAMNYCNKSASSMMEINTRAYTVNGVVNPSILRAKFSNVPALESDYSLIYVWRWKANSNAVYVDNTSALKMRILRLTGELVIDNLSYLRWAELKTVAEKLGYSTASDFFKNVEVQIDLRDPLADYDAITVAYYNSSGTVLDSIQSLIPAFYSNPKNYAYDTDGSARNVNLAAIHPFKSVTGWDNDEKHFQSLADALCAAWN